jgi:N-acetylmuramoyl-L-alanine amidase
MLTRHGSNPVHFTYWAGPTATPVTLSGAPTANNVSYLYNPIFSPSGNFLCAIRFNTSNGNYEPIVWKMPSSSSLTYKPVTITAPVGASISSWLSASINDYGIIAANGTVSGQTRALVWTLNTAATSLQGAILPNLINNGFTNTVGLSNHSNPIIAGTALISGHQQRATVWKYNSPSSFTVTNLGTLPYGNFSNIAKISPNGTLAGISNTLSGNALKQQIFCATPVIPADSYSIDPTLYRLSPQGEPSASSPNITHLTNAGEMIATHYSATSQQIKSLLRQGKSYSLDSVLPPSSGYVLETIHSINSQGTLFVTAWKDGAQNHLLLTPDRDTDGDGLPDAFENEHSFNPFAKNTPSADTDSDGLSDLLEYANGTHPRNADSDSDGIKDGWEVEWGLLPLDPSDALLDPDEDRVTNLRESQIGTIPTGIHKLEILHTDIEWQYPTILATGDDGTLIRTGASTSNDLSTESIYGYGNTQEILAQTTSNIVTLPARQGSYYYNNDWTYQAGSDSWQNFYPDASSGQIHGNIYRYNYLSDANIGESFSEETIFLTPDITNFPEETGWIPWNLIEKNLRNSELHNGSPPLNEWEYLSYYDGIVSPSGTRRLHRSDTWQQFLLNERGEFIELLPSDHTWQKLNDNGIAACYEAWSESSDGGSTYTYRPWLFLSDGQAHLLPHDPSTSDYPSYELLAFSNDGKALLRNGYLNHQSTWANRYFLFDTATGALDLIRLPVSAYPSVSSLSNQNGRLLIQGDKPSQITPDGTCIRLDALRIFDSADASPVPLSNIYPRALNPTHISSAGRITLTTTNNLGQQIILQVIKHNDTNNDGLPDDWQQAFNITDPFADDDGDGLPNQLEYEIGTDPNNWDTDGDGISDYDENIRGKDPLNPNDVSSDEDGDGLSNHEEQELGTDPLTQNVIGPINFGFDENITDFPDLSFRDEHPSDLFDQSSISGWSAHSGSHIEVWRKENESTYVELQSHWDSHGVKQTFQLLPKGKCNFILRYKGRYDGFEYQNAFKLKIAGADQVELDGVAVSKENGEHVKNYMEDDESDKYADWKNVVVSITAPPDRNSLKDITLSLVPVNSSYGNEHCTYGGFVDLVPVEVVELSPKLVDENDVVRPGSEKPAISPRFTEMVERDPLETPAINDASKNHIAWRDMKVKIGKAFAYKTVKWEMTPQFTPSVVISAGPPEVIAPDPAGARFRGKWGTAANENHRNQFSKSEKYGAMNFIPLAEVLEDETSVAYTVSALTTVDAHGYTAVRVNLPPIGFNKSRIKIKIEGLQHSLDLIDLEVPAVIVIDPGHGGAIDQAGTDNGKLGGSSWNNARSYGVRPVLSTKPKQKNETPEAYWTRIGKTLEKSLTLDFGLTLKKFLVAQSERQNLSIKIYMTRSTDWNVAINSRAQKARNYGADNFLSLHFNGDDDNFKLRGPETLILSKSEGNINLGDEVSEDRGFARKIQNCLDLIPGAPQKREKIYRDIKEYNPSPSWVYLDSSDYLNNTAVNPCSHACLAEIEYITSVEVEEVLVSGKQAQINKVNLLNLISNSVIFDIKSRKNHK